MTAVADDRFGEIRQCVAALHSAGLGASVVPCRLNSHIDYSVRPAPAGVKDHSLATPVDLTVSADAATATGVQLK